MGIYTHTRPVHYYWEKKVQIKQACVTFDLQKTKLKEFCLCIWYNSVYVIG